MKPALRKMKSRLANIGEAMTPAKPTVVAMRYREGLVFQGKVYPDFEAIHAEFPGKYHRDPIGVEVHVVDGRTGDPAPPSWEGNA